MIKTSQFKNAFSNWNKLSLLKVVKYTSFIIGAIILIFVLIFIFFSGPFIDTFLKDRITKAFTNAYPAYSIQLGDMHYNVWKNRLRCDSVILKTSKFTCSVASFSVSGIGAMKILQQRNFTPNSLSSSVIDAQKIELNFHPSRNVIRFGSLHISIPDSEMTSDSIKYYSLLGDEQFFAKSQFKQTRFRFDISQIKIMGLDFLALLQGNIYDARSINLHDVFADIFVNMDKPYDKNSSNPQMPNEALSSMKEIVRVDSVKIISGRLNYSERFAVGAKPGVVTFNKVNISVNGIANHTVPPKTAVLHGEGLFMNSGAIKLFMAIPLTSTNFSLQYSGSFGAMDVIKLNSFIEAGEHHRIKSGALQSATFNIKVNSGQANGTLRVLYKDLSIAILNKNTGSENGIFDRISSLISKVFIIRGTNMPDKKGLMKIGEIKYTRKPDESFTQFVWFALRSGVGNVVGFTPK
ncbi:MAG: hypothetical protein M0P61_00800 [Ignavibacteriaceae bacterium]|jgi:hypothetical protein|nr:hypothetical protein [Ignavibacteriaceae bacterium]